MARTKKAPPAVRPVSQMPTLARETALWRDGHRTVAGLDEVGRGAWAGPVVVGLVVIDDGVAPLPEGTRDSKLLTAASRERIAPTLETWCRSWSLGAATSCEIDELGLSAALRLAARRAIAGSEVLPDVILVDGSYDFVADASPDDGASGVDGTRAPVVVTVVKGDQTCGTIAAASILAKVFRDGEMTRAAGVHPDYGFESNSGYGTRSHERAIAASGLTPIHRRSWAFGDRILEARRPRRSGSGRPVAEPAAAV